jgi:pimeloyl-ACP methyl ester carboxylesterase
MKVNFADKSVGGFNYELLRGISTQDVGAAEYGECMDTMERIKNGDFESWIVEWSVTADRVAGAAEEAVHSGNKPGARIAFLKASNYYRMAVFYARHTDPRHTTLWKRSKDCFHSMNQLLDCPIEEVNIDFEGAKLPAYFVSGGDGPRPTLIAMGGFDSTMEEVFCWIGAVAVNYGWHCLIFEGPGQWGALKANPGLVFRPDYEKPVGAVVDYLFTRPDVDTDKLALIGYSAGGYFAPRAAAGEHRIKACIINTLVVDCGEAARAGLKGLRNAKVIDTMFSILMRLSPAARWGFQHSQWTLGIQKPHEWPAAYTDFTLKGLEREFTNPMLFLFSEDDIIDAAASTSAIVAGLLDFIQSLPCDRYAHLFTRREGASSHCQMGGMSYARSVIFEWLNQLLCSKGLLATPSLADREAFIGIFKKYGGGEKAGEKARKLLDDTHLI